MTFQEFLWDLAITGVNHSIEGNGGPLCMSFIPDWQKYLESLIFVPAASYLCYRLWPYLDTNFTSEPKDSSRYWVLALYSLIFGAEITYKIISKTGIFLLNPCHVTTLMQLWLLCSDGRSKRECFIYRLMIYFSTGAVFALAFPVLNSRLLPGEVLIYYIQHIAIVITPPYLLYHKGAFEAERADDFVWPVFALCIFLLYHYVVLQFMGLYTGINLNNTLCPAVSDPFRSRFYRMCAICHQFLLVPIISKTHSALGSIVANLKWEYRQLAENCVINAAKRDENSDSKTDMKVDSL
ncbi:unnamed protein product, partial [Mesorhabditis belari]|uniref:Transmembrane protein 164 n=1 Tax=Mesorhabditis belari TaxID=2138241 RepID=A0AAF3FLH6_9BILA